MHDGAAVPTSRTKGLRKTRWFLCGMTLLLSLPGNPSIQAQTPGVQGVSSNDVAAAKFALSCAGCHSLTGVKLKGPELNAVAAWPQQELEASIKKMEKNVGPLTAVDIGLLCQFLKDPTAVTRLKEEQERVSRMYATKLDPPSPKIGRSLFMGTSPLKNGGMPCLSCHIVETHGGSLGPDLTAIFAKMGEAPLISGIEKASFKIMEPAYRNHPVSKQEALHLTKYLSTLKTGETPAQRFSYGALGACGALLFLVGMTLFYKKQNQSRREPLKRKRP